ncbi:MAG: DUF835 domain-containing protein [Candidatus Methanoperedens sp.]|nr:DUF835 domain-containing protein [Candidatus Methanoperedens sp.]
MLSLIVFLFSIIVLLYAGLGVYVLNKNKNDRSNQMFAILMFVFILWSVIIYNINLVASSAPLSEIFPAVKIQFSGMILALAAFVILSFTDRKTAIKSPLLLLIILLSLYNLYIIWTTDITQIGVDVLKLVSWNMQDYFILSSVFGIAGIYLLLRYYLKSKYRQPDQAKLIIAGAITAVMVSVTANIILPMFFNIYLLGLTTFAPSVMGLFFAYSVYQYGFCIRLVPEISPTSFCGVNCMECLEYINRKCRGCRFEKDRYMKCDIHICLAKKARSGCGDCPEIIDCKKRKEIGWSCFSQQPRFSLLSGTFLVEDKGYEILLDSTKMGTLGIVVTTELPSKIRQDHGLKTTTVVWIANNPEGTSPEKLGRLGLMLANSMKKLEASGGGVVLLDAVKELVEVNGADKVLNFITLLDKEARTHNVSLLIASAGGEFEDLLKKEIKVGNYEGITGKL